MGEVVWVTPSEQTSLSRIGVRGPYTIVGATRASYWISGFGRTAEVNRREVHPFQPRRFNPHVDSRDEDVMMVPPEGHPLTATVLEDVPSSSESPPVVPTRTESRLEAERMPGSAAVEPVIPFGVGAPTVPTAPAVPATEGVQKDMDLPGDPYFDDNFSIVAPSDEDLSDWESVTGPLQTIQETEDEDEESWGPESWTSCLPIRRIPTRFFNRL